MLNVPGGAKALSTLEGNMTGQPVTTGGAVLTPVVGSKGAYVTLIASLAADTYGLIIQIHNTVTSAANRSYAVDIAIGAAGSEIVIIPDLIGSNAATYTSPGGGIFYYFPIFIPAGTRVSARAQGSVVTSCRVVARAYQNPVNPSMIRTCGYVEELGLTGIVGTSVTAGTTSEGSWVSVGTTTRDLWWWQLGAQIAVADVAFIGNCVHFDIAHGDGTNFRIISQNITFSTNTSESCSIQPQFIGCEAFVPSGSTIYVRAQADAATDALEVAVYGAG